MIEHWSRMVFLKPGVLDLIDVAVVTFIVYKVFMLVQGTRALQMMLGFVMMVASGALLFTADARPLWANPVMQVKFALIAAGLVNALLFRALWNRRLAGWEQDSPTIGRAQAGLSFLIWIGVATCGRFAGYF